MHIKQNSEINKYGITFTALKTKPQVGFKVAFNA